MNEINDRDIQALSNIIFGIKKYQELVKSLGQQNSRLTKEIGEANVSLARATTLLEQGRTPVPHIPNKATYRDIVLKFCEFAPNLRIKVGDSTRRVSDAYMGDSFIVLRLTDGLTLLAKLHYQTMPFFTVGQVFPYSGFNNQFTATVDKDLIDKGNQSARVIFWIDWQTFRYNNRDLYVYPMTAFYSATVDELVDCIDKNLVHTRVDTGEQCYMLDLRDIDLAWP